MSPSKKKDELELSRMECELFQKLLEAIYSNLEITEILKILAEGIKTILRIQTVLISLYDKSENIFERKVQAGIPKEDFVQLKKQKVPFKEIKILLKPEFRLGNSYYIPHTYFKTHNKYKRYIDEYGRRIMKEKKRKGRKWHSNDVFLTPIKTSDENLLGIVSVDNPIDDDFPSKKSISLMESFSTYASIAIENVRVLKGEKEFLTKMNSIHTISKIIGQIFDLKTLYNETIHIIRDRFGYKNIAIFEIHSSGKPILKSFSGYTDFDIRRATKDLKDRGLTAEVLKTNNPLLIPNIQDEPRYIGDNSRPKSEAIIPLIIKNRIIGILDVEMDGKNSLIPEDLYILTLLGEYIAMSIDNAHLYRQTQRLAIKDEMTGTYNYRYFKEALKNELKNREKTKESFSLLMIDLDNFKKLNDTFGHIKGDKVLKKVSGVLKNAVRKKDIVTRYGGDEFVIILWDVGKEAAKVLAERIRKIVKRELTEFNFPLTLSIGISAFPADGQKVGILLDKVDKALYRAKVGGRDRISV
jgi:diguanylate cyclase (GGDEF)-like protein